MDSPKQTIYYGNYFGVNIPIAEYKSPQMLQKSLLTRIPLLQDFLDIACMLNTDPTKLAWLAYHKELSVVEHYTHFLIPKRKGGYRQVSKPKPLLDSVQQQILSKILSAAPIHAKATAYRLNFSIYKNAEFHCGKKLVIRIDLKDFFTSIRFLKVLNVFEYFGYNHGVSTVLALLCTEASRELMVLDNKKYYISKGERFLPQGACTSPYISNLSCSRLDARLDNLSAKFKYEYSRYSDDLCFSTNTSPVKIGNFLRIVDEIIRGEGFQVNSQKTRILRNSSRQMVTGLTVNRDISIPRDKLKRYRAFLYYCELSGSGLQEYAKNYALGYFNFINSISPSKAWKIAKKHPWIVSKQSVKVRNPEKKIDIFIYFHCKMGILIIPNNLDYWYDQNTWVWVCQREQYVLFNTMMLKKIIKPVTDSTMIKIVDAYFLDIVYWRTIPTAMVQSDCPPSC